MSIKFDEGVVMKEYFKVNDANQEIIDDLRKKYGQYKKALSTEDPLKVKKAHDELINAIHWLSVESTKNINDSIPYEKYELICGKVKISCVIEPNEELHLLLNDISETLKNNTKDV